MNTVTIIGGCLYNTFDSGLPLRKDGSGVPAVQHAYTTYDKDIEMIPFSPHRPALAVDAARIGRRTGHHTDKEHSVQIRYVFLPLLPWH